MWETTNFLEAIQSDSITLEHVAWLSDEVFAMAWEILDAEDHTVDPLLEMAQDQIENEGTFHDMARKIMHLESVPDPTIGGAFI